MTPTRLPFAIASILALAVAAACATGEGPGDQGADDRGDHVEGLDEVDAGASAADGGPGVDAGGGGCPTDPCDLQEQCGCPEQDACDLEFTDFDEGEFTDGVICRGVRIPGDELSACGGPEDCAAGFQCIGDQCRAYCENDSDCGGAGAECALTRSGSERSDDSLCTKSCDPVFDADHAAACPDGTSCYIRFLGSGDSRRPLTDCRQTGEVGLDDDCSSARCEEGMACLRFGDDSRRCRLRCHEDQTCPNGEPCQLFSDGDGEGGTIVEGREYGYCPD